jgi:hypothetical protein
MQRRRTRARRILGFAAALIGLGASVPALADYWFQVPDASQLKYVISVDGKVYLRNLNQFDSAVLGCCYNYWIDLTSSQGPAVWATLLAKIEAQQEIWIFVGSPTAASYVYVGDL